MCFWYVFGTYIVNIYFFITRSKCERNFLINKNNCNPFSLCEAYNKERVGATTWFLYWCQSVWYYLARYYGNPWQHKRCRVNNICRFFFKLWFHYCPQSRLLSQRSKKKPVDPTLACLRVICTWKYRCRPVAFQVVCTKTYDRMNERANDFYLPKTMV